MNNNVTPRERRHIEHLLGQGMQQSDVARIVKRSRATITTIAGQNRKSVSETKAEDLTRLRRAK